MPTHEQHPGNRPATAEDISSPQRKPANLSWESFADRRIREAAESGAFDQLPGLGQPIPGIDQPLDENWWVKRKLRDEQLSVVPPTLEARRERERVLEAIGSISNEQEVRQRLTALNQFIRDAIYSTAPGPADGVQLVDIEAAMSAWRTSRAEGTESS